MGLRYSGNYCRRGLQKERVCCGVGSSVSHTAQGIVTRLKPKPKTVRNLARMADTRARSTHCTQGADHITDTAARSVSSSQDTDHITDTKAKSSL